MSEDAYGEGVAYWDARYTKEPKPTDWVLKYWDLRDIISNVAEGRKDTRILHVGCGNSLLPEHMYDEGYRIIVNIDTSVVVINQMRARNAQARPCLEWSEMDATATSFDDESFDFVLDKTMLDTLLCEGDDEGLLVSTYFKELYRVLSSTGVVLMVSFGPPELRVEKVPSDLFDVESISVQPANGCKNHITGSGCHYAYLLRKRKMGFDAIQAAPNKVVATAGVLSSRPN